MKEIADADLEMPRAKPRSLAISATYRLVRLGRALFGAKAMLRLFLNLSWLSWRFAFELSSDVFGSAFQTEARGVSDELLARHIPEGGTVLDVGCGAGRWSRIAARHARQVVGVDQQAHVIAEARRDTRETNVEYTHADIRDVIGGRQFDVALLIHVLEHVDDIDAFLALMRAAAKVVIVEVPNFEVDPLNGARLALRTRFYTDADHVREYTAAMLRAHLERNAFDIVELQERRGSIVAVARPR